MTAVFSKVLFARGGLRFGALAGLFYAVQQVSSIARAEKGLQDVVTAGAATGALFGATGDAQAASLSFALPQVCGACQHAWSWCAWTSQCLHRKACEDLGIPYTCTS